MAVEAYQVAVSLILDSNVEGAVSAISEQFEALQGILGKIQGSLETLFEGFQNLADIGKAAAASWDEAAASLDRAATSAKEAAASMKTAVEESDGGSVLGSKSSKGGGGHGGVFPGIASLAEGLALYAAFKSSMSEDLSARQAALNMGYKPGTPEYDAAINHIESLSHNAAQGTVFSERQVSNAVSAVVGTLLLSGNTPAERAAAMKKLDTIMPTAILTGEVAHQNVGGSVEDNTIAAIQYAHMTNRFGPKDLQAGLDVAMKVARITHQTLGELINTSKYALPVGQSFGFNPDEVTELVGYEHLKGLSNTTAGTAVGQMIQSLVPDQLKHGKETLHNLALQAMHIFDSHDRLQVHSLAELQDKIVAYRAAHPDKFGEANKAAFGTRGGRASMNISEASDTQRLQQLHDQINNMPGAAVLQKAEAESPQQKFQQVLARLADVGNDLAQKTLPAVNTTLNRLLTALQAVNKEMDKHPVATEAGGYGLLGLIGAQLLHGLYKGGKWLFSPLIKGGKWLLGLGGEEAATAGGAVAEGAGAGEALAATAAIPGIGWLVAGLAILAGGGYLAYKYLNGNQANAAPGSTPQQQQAGSSVVPSMPTLQMQVELKGDVDLDAKKVGSVLAKGVAQMLNSAKSGPTGVNPRSGPIMPGYPAGALAQ